VPRGCTAAKAMALAGAVLMLAAPAFAQVAEPSATAEPSVKELQKEIRKRDALIESLARRVEKLERQVSKQAGSKPAPRPAVVPAVATSAALAPSAATAVSFTPEQTAQATTPSATTTPAPPIAPAPSAAAAPAPGQFEVNPEAAERALERTLVATGNLLVPTGFAEIEPLISYVRREFPTLVLFNVNRNEITPILDGRVGLPWESQIEVALPWNFDEQQTLDNVVSPAQQISDRWGNSVGDLSVGLAKTLVHESGWIPSLLGRVSWEAPTGPMRANGVPVNGGDNRVSFQLTALKRQDPLVFAFTGGYTRAFVANGINPGNEFTFQPGAFLATSPETSLRAVLTQNFIQDVAVNGVTIPGSNTVQPIMTFGASTILGRGILVDLQVGLGLTNSAPKYQVVLSSTYRFGVTGH